VLSIFRKLMKNDDGVTAIEYVLIVCLIGTVAIGAMTILGHTLLNPSGPVASALH
jgi:pilus assembly protein Flp/PilA